THSLLESLNKNRERVRRTAYQEPNEGCGVLRARHERPCSRCAAKNRYKVTAVHSICASARARKVGGGDAMKPRPFLLAPSLPFVASRSSGFSSRLADLPPRKDPSYAWRLADNTLVARFNQFERI